VEQRAVAGGDGRHRRQRRQQLDLGGRGEVAAERPRQHVPAGQQPGDAAVADQAGTAYTSPTSSSPNYGMVRVTQRTFVPSPPAGTDLLELRFRVPTWSEEAQITTTVDLRQARPTEQLGAT
jgi:hypothetical protein